MNLVYRIDHVQKHLYEGIKTENIYKNGTLGTYNIGNSQNIHRF